MKNIRIRVAGLALNKKNELLLVNHEKNGKSYWLIPGGGVEYGETFAEALRREFREELNMSKLRVGNLVFINETIYPGRKRHIINLYFRVKMKSGEKIRVNPERVLKAAGFVTVKKFKKLLFYPGIKSVIINEWKKGFCRPLGYIKTKWKK